MNIVIFLKIGMAYPENDGTNTAKSVSTSSDQPAKRKRKLLFLLIFLFIIVFIIIICMYLFFIRNNGNTADDSSTDSTQDREETSTDPSTDETEVAEDPEETDETPACAPIFSVGDVVSHTSTDTTWSYYFSGATSESVSAYVEQLSGDGFLTISDKTLASTTFWDLQKGNCFISLRYHAPDNGVILEIREETN